jgi:hypothetical protein
MRRKFLVAAAVLTLSATTGVVPRPARAAQLATGGRVECTDYCAERAAAHCDRIDSWKCAWYIIGCLAGCNIAQL